MDTTARYGHTILHHSLYRQQPLTETLPFLINFSEVRLHSLAVSQAEKDPPTLGDAFTSRPALQAAPY